MSDILGSEFVNLREWVLTSDIGPRDFRPALLLGGEGLDVGRFFAEIRTQAEALLSVIGPVGDNLTTPWIVDPGPRDLPQRGIVFYLPPGRYLLPRLATDPPTEPTVYELPENVQLYFCQGALLRPAEGVELVIRGSLHAGMYQIFGYDRYKDLPAGITGVNTVPKGRVVFATRLVPVLYPEWWGAILIDTGLPSYPSLMGEELRAAVRAALRSHDSSDALQSVIEAACVTRDHPRPASRPRPSIPVMIGGPYQCFRTLSVNILSDHGVTSRFLILRGSSGRGTPNAGKPTITRFRMPEALIDGSDDAAGTGCLLRLGPNVNFEFEDIGFGVNDDATLVDGCIDIICTRDEIEPRRGLIRRCTILGGSAYALRITEMGDSCPRHFFVDGCVLTPGSASRLTQRGVAVRAGSSVMLHLDGSLLGRGPAAFEVYPSLPDNATMYLQGGSVLVRASQFHNASGPRPSRGDDRDASSIRLDRPDGQEVFLAPVESGRASAHFTAVHVECQGWWFLSRPAAGDEHVVLINLAHSNVNWGADSVGNRRRFYAGAGTDTPVPTEGTPPSVVWLGDGGQCVLIGCRLDWSLLTDGDAVRQIIDVGTVFHRFPASGPGRHFRPVNNLNSIVRPPFYQWIDLADGDALDSRVLDLVPIMIS